MKEGLCFEIFASRPSRFEAQNTSSAGGVFVFEREKPQGRGTRLLRKLHYVLTIRILSPFVICLRH